MKIASFPWKVVENVPNNPEFPSENGCVVFQVFFNWSWFGPVFGPFSRKRDQNRFSAESRNYYFFLERSFSTVYKSNVAV